MATQDWNPISGNSTGDILKSGLSYTGESDDEPEIKRDTGSGQEQRVFLNYQTGADPLPQRAIIEKVELLLRINTHTVGTAPTSYKWTFLIGQDIVQDAITTNENAIWNSSDWIECHEENFAAGPVDTDIDLGDDGITYFNRRGDTDIMIRDTSLWGIFGADYTTIIYGSAGARSSYLKVTYRIGQIRDCKLYNCKIYSGG